MLNSDEVTSRIQRNSENVHCDKWWKANATTTKLTGNYIQFYVCWGGWCIPSSLLDPPL